MKRLFALLMLAFVAMSCEQIQDFIDDKGHGLVFLEGEMKAYFPDKGDTKNYKFKADLAWSAEVSADWVEVDPTSGPAGENKIKIKVNKNNSDEKRTGYVDITLSNEKSYRIELEQLAEGENLDDVIPSISIPSNEIWYTSADGNIVEPYSGEYNEYADVLTTFGVNIVSNTFDAEKECWVIKFDGDITTIGDWAFFNCSGLTSLTIPDSVTTIGYAAFAYCSSLTSATIPDSVTTIGDGAFDRCSSLTSIIIPDSVTTIGNWAFEGCSSLTSVTIPDSVTSIGVAFFGCTGELVVNCNIPDASYFDNSTFYGSQFTSVTIGDSVTTIGRWAFSFCSSLTSVTIGDSVTTIGDGVFFGCDSLTKFNGKFVSEDGRCLIVDDTLMSFAIGCGATEYVIPRSVTVIGHYAFYRCFSLISVTIPDSVTTIGHQSFNQCTGLTSVVIPDSVTIIGGYAFSGCDSLTSVTIPDSVTTIRNAIFGHCRNLTEFNGKFASEDGRCLFFNGILNSFAPAGLTEYTIPDSVTAIGWNAFSYCDSLTSVTIPDSVIAIGYEAFYGCTSLTSVYCRPATPPTAEVYDNYWRAFDENTYSREIYVPKESVEAYKSANYWGNYADAIVGYNFETGEVDDTEVPEEPEEPELSEYVIEYTSTDGDIVVP